MADEKKELSNVRALSEFRLKGKKVVKGEVVSKKSFANKGEWQNLCNMKPARCEETSATVGKPKAEGEKANKAAMPGATK